jgi:hypothetical protein
MELKFYLNPIGENLAIASVCNQFFGKLGDTGVQVVHNHMHNSGGRLGPARILGDGISSVDQQPNLFQTSKGSRQFNRIMAAYFIEMVGMKRYM